MVYNFAVAPQLASPRIFQATGWQTELYTLGGNSSDFQYGTLFLDGNLTYRLTGNINCRTVRTRGTSFMMPIGSKEDGPCDQGRPRHST